MPTPPLSDELAREAAEAFKAHGRKYLAAEALGLDQRTFAHRLSHAARRGMLLDHGPAMPGFEISKVTTLPDGKQSIQQKQEPGEFFEIPAGLKLKGVTALVDAEGRVMHRHIMAREGGVSRDPAAIADILKHAFKDYEPAAPVSESPPCVSTDFLTLLPCNDWHVGMFAWGPESGENWDLKIAENTIMANIDNVLKRSIPSATCIVLGGGDLMHADNMRNETERSKNPLDVDGRYAKVLETAQRMMVGTIESALRQHGHVIGRILRGNHDEHSAIGIAHFLKAWFRNDSRVTIDTDPSLYWWHRFGSVLLGATHGHTTKLSDMPGIMAHRRASDWGETIFRYVHGFHVHHKSKLGTEGLGVICESHQAPIPQDAWHFGSGFLSGRSLQAITYHREFGEWDRVGKGIRSKANVA